MRTLFKSQDLWDLVEDGFDDSDVKQQRLKENRKKDAKALLFLQSPVHENIFSRASADNLKEAWQILKTEFKGSDKVIAVKLQTLRRDFETLNMQNNESVQDYLSRASTIVNKMKSYGEDISNKTVVPKILRSLTSRFDSIVAAIEEAHDMSTYSFDELMSSLQAHEERLNRSKEKNEEKAFQVKGESSKENDNNNFGGRGNGRGGFRGRGRGGSRGRGQYFGQR
ncbi:uncharacterized protein LOC141632724 [Silene latifolia]|uniref:uncharacterized protein LOC141632724 n=1 Tax=Silene latifolia TaxID=37657 RepID=UPI003D77AAB2